MENDIKYFYLSHVTVNHRFQHLLESRRALLLLYYLLNNAEYLQDFLV